jgi:hypothetical protein
MELIRKELYKDKESWGWRGNKKSKQKFLLAFFI